MSHRFLSFYLNGIGLTPGEDEWAALIKRVGIKEAKARRQAALKQVAG
jgi:hypothetical protein